MTTLLGPPRNLPWPRSARTLLGLLAAVAVVLGTTALAGARPSIEREHRPPVGSLEQIDHSIQSWTANLVANDRDFYAATNLGLLYEARGRISGDVTDYERARAALDRALAIVPADSAARLLHARVLLSLHDFMGALGEARAIEREQPDRLDAKAVVGDASLELGDLGTAGDRYATLARLAPGAPVTARQSRLAFVVGDPGAALRLADRAYGESALSGEGGSQLAWYAYLAGTMRLATGDPTGARTWFEQSLSSWPTGYLPLAGLARVEAAIGRIDAAIHLYGRAIAVAPQPEALAALGDLYAIRGDATLAGQQYATVEAIGDLAAIQAQVFNRQLVLFDVNHGRDLPTALALAERELEVRKDVYGYDAYAWALLANDRPIDAQVAIERALASGTKDSLLDYHAGMIALRLADRTRAAELLASALSRPGALDPLAAREAARVLESLR